MYTSISLGIRQNDWAEAPEVLDLRSSELVSGALSSCDCTSIAVSVDLLGHGVSAREQHLPGGGESDVVNVNIQWH